MPKPSGTARRAWQRHLDIPYVQGIGLVILGLFSLSQAAGNLGIVLIAAVMFALAAAGMFVHSVNRKAGR